ncbi:hypothetical protein PVW46_14140 [Mameliella sp. AT18]|uniref:hypothetical protein n=1 Tax=Mameliella sp. AT18 TaxID=3028385 RepID=UPI0008410814|nr:hypothetical protein [Mameliella sp. AT18]MDD9731052.1 hypothetical protein [Mameliella sp. AT18]ODM46509.1 hypothetical protein A9320_26150 [Ruegeria sp. PBVC088]
MSDVTQQIMDLINAEPLPADAEDRLSELIEQLPEEDQDMARATWSEALFMARQSADFDPAARTVELDL